MSASRIYLDRFLSFGQKLSKLVQIWRSSDKKNLLSFFGTRCRRYNVQAIANISGNFRKIYNPRLVTSSSAMAERPRGACSSILWQLRYACSQWRCLANKIKSVGLDGWVNLRLNFRSKGYVLRQYLWTVRWVNGYTTICRWKFSHKETLS